MKFKILGTVLTAAILCVSQNIIAEEIPTAMPEEVGMSSERLLRINVAIQRHIAAGDIQGAVTVVARRGKLVHFEAKVEGTLIS